MAIASRCVDWLARTLDPFARRWIDHRLDIDWTGRLTRDKRDPADR